MLSALLLLEIKGIAQRANRMFAEPTGQENYKYHNKVALCYLPVLEENMIRFDYPYN